MMSFKQYLTEKIVYHGGELKDNKRVLFVTPNKETAKSYAVGRSGVVHAFELNIKNPADDDVIKDIVSDGIKDNKWQLKDFDVNGMITGIDLKDLDAHIFLSQEMVGKENVDKMINELMQKGYDSAEVSDYIEAGSTIQGYTTVYAIWDKEQLKRVNA
jgi:hypothetical protein